MRVAGLGQYISNPYKGITKGIRQGFEALGHEFFPVELVKSTIGKAKRKLLEIGPDLIFSHCLIDGHTHNAGDVLDMAWEVKRETGCKFVYQEGDYRDVSERPRVNLDGIADLIVFNQDHQLDEHAKLWNVKRERCVPFPYAGFIFEKRPSLKHGLSFELVFIGASNEDHYAERNSCLEKMEYAGLPLMRLPNEDVSRMTSYAFGPNIYLASCVCLSYDFVSHIRHFSSDRPFIITGAGGFCLAHRSNGLDEILIGGEHLVYFDTPEEAIELYNKWHNDLEGQLRIKGQAFDYVQKHQTWKNRVSDLIAILNGEKDHITFLYKEIKEKYGD